MNSVHEWMVTQQMMLGDFSCDFNPFHDPNNGQFTSGHGLVNHTNKSTGLINPSYYPKIAKKLGVSLEEAKVMADAVNEYTRHSTEFRKYTANPEKYAAEYGDAMAAKFAEMLKNIEGYIKKAPKWSGGRLYRGLEIAAEDYESFVANIKAGKNVRLGGSSSWSSDRNVADTFAGHVRGIDINGDKMSVVLINSSRRTDLGASISNLSGAPTKEWEVLVTEQAHFEPNGKVVDLGNVLYVYGEIKR